MTFLEKFKERQSKKRLSSVLCALMCTGLLTVSGNVGAAGFFYGTSDGKGTNGSVPNLIASNNGKVTVNTGDNYIEVIGGCQMKTNDLVYGNKVTINDGTVDSVYGGYASKSYSKDNVVLIKNGVINGKVAGGYSIDNEASGNSVTVNGGTFATAILGGHSVNGIVQNNSVTITDGTFNCVNNGRVIYGGYAVHNISQNNNLTITGGNFDTDLFYSGGFGDGSTYNNRVNISDVDLGSSAVFGGFSYKGEAKNNIVNVKNISSYEVFGAQSGKGCSDNIVNVINSNLSAVYGGASPDGKIYNNIVTVTGGEITNVYGGFALYNDKPTDITIENNTVVLNGANVTGKVAGADKGFYVESNPIIKNNTLEIKGLNNKAGNVENFSTLNFCISKEAVNNDTMLKVTGNADIINTNVNAALELGSNLKVGDQIILIDAGTLNADGIKTSTGTMTDGLINTKMDINIKDVNKLVATISPDTITEDAKSPVESRIPMLSVLNNGANLLASAGLENAAYVAEDELNGSMHPFITMSGNKTKLTTGSHVDVAGYNMNLGFVKKLNNNAGKFVYAPVIEYGRGNYDSYLDNGTHGEGDAHYWGAGLIAKQVNEDGLYYEGSLRAGRTSIDYKSAVAGGISYDSDATYYAAHAGLGKIVTINDADSIDYYGKLFYNRMQGDKVTVGSCATYDFDATTSLRTNLGARYNHKMDAKNIFYAGLAWQHEFDGEANAIVTTNLGSGSTPAPSIKGDTGIMELGWNSNTSDKLELDLRVNGSVGKEKGLGFTMKFDFKF